MRSHDSHQLDKWRVLGRQVSPVSASTSVVGTVRQTLHWLLTHPSHRKVSRTRVKRLQNLTVLQLIKKFTPILWHPKVHYCFHNSPSPNPSSEPDEFSLHTLIKTHFNIILPSTPRSSKHCFLRPSPPKPCKQFSFLQVLEASPASPWRHPHYTTSEVQITEFQPTPPGPTAFLCR